MVKIRLTRLGKHKSPFYRIVATDSRVKRDGKYIALLGTYEPFEGKTILKTELIHDFLNKGAQPSETVLNILKQNGIWKDFNDAKKTAKKPVAKKATKKAKTTSKKSKTTKAKKTTKKATAETKKEDKE